MKIRFWGTRGSIPSPGPATVKYGGNTSCVEVQSDKGTMIILDCGSGLRALGQMLLGEKAPLRGHILLTHTHWDHIQGLPFFTPLFIQGNEWDIYAPFGFEQSLRQTLAGQMQYAYFPVTLENLGAQVRYHQLVEGELSIDDIKITTHYLNHTALTLGYRLEADGVTIVYSTDHEPYSQPEAKGIITEKEQGHIRFLEDADLVIHDSQYLAKEYQEKRGWGHSTVEYVVEVCRLANVKTVVLTHHDPSRSDVAIDEIVKNAQEKLKEKQSSMQVIAAAEGQTLTLTSSFPKSEKEQKVQVSALAPKSAIVSTSVILGISDLTTASLLMKALQADGIETIIKQDGKSTLRSVFENPPSLLIVEKNLPEMDGLSLCQTIRNSNRDFANNLPIILIVDHEDEIEREAEGVTDWLSKPFSEIYAKTRIHAWLLRIACRWEKARLPENEEKRLAILKKLNILDSDPEERFDRLTRLAASLFDVPIVLFSLLDKDRQWFKSCQGIDVKESSRETSFCAHTILQKSPLIIPDTLLDERFADNPLVTKEPRIRFYAGQPLILSEGICVGTLCLIDTKPRQISEESLNLLKDLGDLITRELLLPKA